MEYHERIAKAEKLVDTFKDIIIRILWDDPTKQYCNIRTFIPWMEEDALYEIQQLQLKSKDEVHYLNLIKRYVGEYTEDID